MSSNSLKTRILRVSENHHFGNVFFDMSIEEFGKLGFVHGDSVTIELSSGKVIDDVPYFSGYYERDGRPLLIAYPNDDRIELAIYCGLAWTWLGFCAEDTAIIYLKERAKYLDIQQALSLEYSINRDDYSSDEEFANFRALKGGRLKDSFIFRSASPVNNKFGRAAFSDRVMKLHGINYLLDISDSDEEISRYMNRVDFSSPYFASLYAAGKCSALKMHAAYKTKDYGLKLAELLRSVISNEGPFLTYCVEGKDRTGFVCCLIGALCGSSFGAMRDDYMETYSNYYGITRESSPLRYEKIQETNFYDFLFFLGNTDTASELPFCDYEKGARKYLKTTGLSDDEIEKLIDKLTK